MKRTFVGLVVLALVAVGATLAAVVASPYGTWSGRLLIPQEPEIPVSAYPTSKLVVGPVWVQAESSGLTMATHDAPNARSTCTMRLRFNGALSAAPGRVYVQVGNVKLRGSVSGGMPEFSACQLAVADVSFRVVVRVRPAGTKLRVEFGDRNRADKPDFPLGAFRGYLRRDKG